ncbi:uncharacterized protein LOC133189418 [Saccostrea echinata]|uniref:uncharacterized protein LOC133189418 n=1 Tax=Saccostrea echinata TaxID=191078 RepID=UPI002A8358D3|nr:uncharacterized protein LOC133189418 [Saccostrea echinata]
MITPEEMAIADNTIEPKLLKYVSMIKWASENSRTKEHHKDVNSENPSKMTSFTVKGSGIVSGVVGRKARFSLTVSDVVGMFLLGVDIKGPKNEVYSEQIISLHQSKEIMIGAYQTQQKQRRLASIDNHVMEYMEDAVGNTYVRWKNLKLLGDSSTVSVIPFNCQCTGERTFLMTYLPISTGIHTVSIKWQNLHIDGSPFKVKVYQPRDVTRRAIRDAKDKRIIFDSLSLSSIEERPLGLLKIGPETDFTKSKSDSEKTSGRSSRTMRMKKQFTVTKRRVIRKVISRHGEEIVIQESPSPSLSRQSSMTDTSTEEEQIRKSHSPSPPYKRKIIPRSARHGVERNTNSDNSDTNQSNLHQDLKSSDRKGNGSASTTCKEIRRDILEDSNAVSNRRANPTLIWNRSFSDSMLICTPVNDGMQSTFRKMKELKKTESKILQTHIPSLKFFQSKNFRNSDCNFSGDIFRQHSFSSTSSASSNSTSSLGKAKKSLSLTRSLPLLNNDVYPYDKSLSRLERIRRDKRYAIEIQTRSERLPQIMTTTASPSTSSLSSLATPTSHSFPWDDPKRWKMSNFDRASADRQVHVLNNPPIAKTPSEDMEKSQCKSSRKNWEQIISKQRATTMYWLNNQTTDHFSVDSTDSDPNFLVEQSIMGPRERQHSLDILTECKPSIVYRKGSLSSVDSKGSASSKKKGLQRQYSKMENLETDLVTISDNDIEEIQKVSSLTDQQEDGNVTDVKSATNVNQATFKSIVTVENIVPSKVRVVTPKVKANKTTQVTVNEILKETGFLSAFYNLSIRRRKKYVKNDTGNQTTTASDALNPIRARSFSDGAIFGQHNDDSDEEDVDHNSRQSTIDSGIAEENQNRADGIPFQRNQNRIIFRQNGHIKLHRRPYQGRIVLDPRLIMSGSNTDSQSDASDGNKSDSFGWRGKTPEESTSFSDTEITTNSIRKRRKRRKLRAEVRLSPVLSTFKNPGIRELQRDAEGSSTDHDDNSEDDVGVAIKSPHLLSVHPNKDSSNSDLSDIGIGVDDAERALLLNDVQSFMHLSQNIQTSLCDKETESTSQDVGIAVSLHEKSKDTNDFMSSGRVFRSSKETILTDTENRRFISAVYHYVSPDNISKRHTSYGSLQLSKDNHFEQTYDLIEDQICVDFEKYIAGLNESLDEDPVPPCTAEGVGLTIGQVGMKNNFQVWCHSQENMAISITIHGPRPFSVLEWSVVYTGDNLYEITYEVAYPGYYVICVNCGDQQIKDSPFLAKITH